MPPPASAFNTFLTHMFTAMDEPKLFDRVRSAARKRHPEEMGADESRQCPSRLAVEGRGAAFRGARAYELGEVYSSKSFCHEPRPGGVYVLNFVEQSLRRLSCQSSSES